MLLRVGVFYGLTLIFTILLGMVEQVLGIGFEKIALPQLGPGLAAPTMLALFKRDKAMGTSQNTEGDRKLHS
jgi:hypothetical protein